MFLFWGHIGFAFECPILDGTMLLDPDSKYDQYHGWQIKYSKPFLEWKEKFSQNIHPILLGQVYFKPIYDEPDLLEKGSLEFSKNFIIDDTLETHQPYLALKYWFVPDVFQLPNLSAKDRQPMVFF